MAKGFIYVLVSDSMPGLVKVGATQFTTPQHRAFQISSGTGIPTPFKVVGSFEVEDCLHVESRIHAALAHIRVHKRKEFFRCAPEYAIEYIQNLIGGAVAFPALNPKDFQDDGLPFSRLFASFPDDGAPRGLSLNESISCRRLEEHLRNGL